MQSHPDRSTAELPVPTDPQLRWQNDEYGGFVHFNMSTFVGTGNHCEAELDPSLFHPTELDCRQWARVARDAGMRMLVLTAKHHDGFCLWPTEVIDYSVKSSSWRGGAGDVVADCAEACAEFGLELGIYLSPWDKQHDSASDEYPAFYDAQLHELLGGRYGEIRLLWLDGYGAKTIGPAAYERWIDTARELQPELLFRCGWGPDGRWGGTEGPVVGYPQWSMLDPDRAYHLRMDEGDGFLLPYLHHGDPDGPLWMPAEADPPSYGNGAWLWHPHAKPRPFEPFDGFEATVWRNSVLLRGLGPDRRGLIPEDVAAYLARCKANRDAFLETRVVTTAAHSEPDERSGARAATSGSVWTASLAAPARVGHVMLGESIAHGQRVRAFTIELGDAGHWTTVFHGESIGRKQLCSFEPRRADRIRVHVSNAVAQPLLDRVTVFPEWDGLSATRQKQ